MLFFVIGIPSRFTEWCLNLTGRIVERVLGPVEVAGANTIEEVGHALIRTTAPHMVLGSYLPVGNLCTALSGGTARFVVSLEDPRRAVGDMVGRHGNDFLFHATRAISNSSAALTSWDAMPTSLVLHGDKYRADPVAAAVAIADHLGLAVSDQDLASAVSAAGETGSGPEWDDGRWWENLDDSTRAVVNGAVEPYAAYFVGGRLGPIIWRQDLFFINEEPIPEPHTVRATGPMDITGRARILIYGPDVLVPSGAWTAVVSFGLSREAAEMSYLVEVFDGTQLAQTRIVPTGSERFIEAILNFSVDASFDHGKLIEVRIWSERAAFDGRIAIGHVKLTRQGDVPAEMKTYFETMLGS